MIRCILLDIEGTTTDIDFVHKVLFPYAAKHLEHFVHQNAHLPHVRQCLNEAQKLDGQDALTDQQVIELLLLWIEQDRKAQPLKELQGWIWEDGYQTGAYQAHIYDDAYEQLKLWSQQGLTLAIYSSGSVKAQKLLFEHTRFGDIRGLLSSYFDTHVGGKKQSQSYQNIAQTLKMQTSDILFLSDILEECQAAHDAGLETAQIVRQGQLRLQQTIPQYSSFRDIPLEI